MTSKHLIEKGYYWLDKKTRDTARLMARRISRRSFLGQLGAMLAGAAMLPLLPVSRAFAQESSLKEIGDPQTCEYWRYCALGGTLCSCCGGTHKTCPPGAEPSPVTWVGTCRNPVDDKDYLISYNDCCGKDVCRRCGCGNAERDRPVYYSSNSNSILWCFGTEHRTYHCTVAVVLGEAANSK
jgi:methylamine dehydrogenase light chain